MTPTVTLLPSSPYRGTARAAAGTASAPASGRTSGRAGARPRRAPRAGRGPGEAGGPEDAIGREAATERRSGNERTAARASRPPHRATAKLTSGAPPSAAYGVKTDSPWLKATRAQGNPPKGNRPRAHSAVTQSAALHNGHRGNRVTRAAPAPQAA